MEDRHLRDSDWEALRDAVPAFAPTWRELTSDSVYDETIPFVNLAELARFVAESLLVQQPESLEAIGSALETLYTEAAITDDEPLEGLLTVGFLENLINAADDAHIDLTHIQPILAGRRTREHWDRAIAYQKPDFVWEEGVGAVPTKPLPNPVGSVEIHRGWADRDAGVCRMDARLLSGFLRAGCLVRHEISKDCYSSWVVVSATVRSPDLPDEYHLTIEAEREEAFQHFEFEMSSLEFRESTWEVAVPHDFDEREQLDDQ